MTDGVQDPANDASKPADSSESNKASESNDSAQEVVDKASGEAAFDASAGAGADSSAIPAASSPALEGAAQRRSPWQSSMAAIQYVGQASATDEVQVRTSDRITVIALLLCCIAEVLSLVYTPMASMRLAFIAISDIVLAVAVTMFLVYRLGILSSLGKRQALICWQLMMGCIFLGIFLCVNVAAGVALGVSAMYPAELP
ncbi:MAG: hypothetical protein WCT03_10920 [Candidatus Obscuribacterales bacterium]|jgi:hypothetical protein